MLDVLMVQQFLWVVDRCFFFSSRRRHTRLQGDWSSDVCSSDLPTTAAHVADEFGDTLLVLDGGACEVGIESTIVDCTRGVPVLLRPGAITRDDIERACGQRPRSEEHTSELQSPCNLVCRLLLEK